MKKYFFNDGTGQQGPFTLEELQTKNIHADTPVWYEGLPDWTTAGKLDELKDILVHTPPAFHTVTTPVEEVKPVVAAAATTTVAQTPAPAAKAAPVSAAKPAKKSTAWLSYVLGLVVLGGVGFLVYQDMQKNKGVETVTVTQPTVADSTASTTTTEPTTATTTTTTNTDTTATGTMDPANTSTTTTTTEPATTEPATTTTTNPSTTTTTTTVKPTTTTTTANTKALDLEAKKAAQKKIDDDKKKQAVLLAAQAAAAAKEKEYRNNWPRYVTFGNLVYDATHDGVDAFNVPVYNGTNGMLDKVTVRVDYLKKDKKVLKSEMLTLYNIAPGSGVNGKAPELRKVNNITIKTYITAISSRKLHFCYPSNNGNSADPYFCN